MNKTQESERIAAEFKKQVKELDSVFKRGCITSFEHKLAADKLLYDAQNQLALIWLSDFES